MDCVVKSWILGTLSHDLADAVLDRGVSARTAWLAVESQFLGNRETRALILDQEFRNVKQGDLNIIDYCSKLQGMAADLRALGEEVPDRTLMLTLIRGLNEQFKDVGRHIRRGRPFPSYLDARNDLLLEELNFNTAPPPPSALLASTGKAAPSPPAPKPPQHAGGHGSSISWGGQKKGKPRFGKRSGSGKPSDT